MNDSKGVHMIKKTLAILSVICVAVASLSSVCFADEPSFGCRGVSHGYNGSYWYDQGWINVHGDTSEYEEDYYIYVWVIRNEDVLGLKRTTVLAEQYSTCYSYQVQGSDGTLGYDWELKE